MPQDTNPQAVASLRNILEDLGKRQVAAWSGLDNYPNAIEQTEQAIIALIASTKPEKLVHKEPTSWEAGYNDALDKWNIALSTAIARRVRP